MKIASIEVTTDGLKVKAVTTEHWNGVPLSYTDTTAWGALHGLADQLHRIAQGVENPAAKLKAIDTALNSGKAASVVAGWVRDIAAGQLPDDSIFDKHRPRSED